MPGMVRPWTKCQSNLADNLRPHMQGDRGVCPLCKRQRRPLVRCAIHFVFLPAVNEISKRSLDPLKHVACFLLCPLKSMFDLLFDGVERSAFFIAVRIV